MDSNRLVWIVFLTLFMVLSTEIVFAQSGPAKHLIRFTDRANSPYSIQKPGEFLSSRAITRRLKQNIPIVENDLPVNPAYIDSLKKAGAVVVAQIKWFNGVIATMNAPNALDNVNSLPFVKSSNKVNKQDDQFPLENKKFDLEIPFEPNNLHFRISNLVYGASENQITMLRGDELHAMGFQGENMQIAVIDNGFAGVDTLAIFDNLRSDNRILATWDFENGNDSVFDDATHGTYVLSVMAGYLENQFIGTAPRAEYYLLRSEINASETLLEEYLWAAAAAYADSAGADVINTSLGYNEFDNPAQDHSYEDMDGNTTPIAIASDIAASKGLLLVTSAGNDGNKPWHFITSPADADSTLTVGAVDAQGKKAVFSSFGPTSDGQIKPDVVAQGLGTALANLSGGVGAGNGTSFSSPIIAGLATCLWQDHPESTNMEIIRAIRKSASQYCDPDNSIGYGIPDFFKADSILDNPYLLDLDLCQFESDAIARVYPNPFENEVVFEIFSLSSQKAILELFDIRGKLIYSSTLMLQKESYSFVKVDELKFLSDGVYFLTVKTDLNKLTEKVVKRSR